jgi:hypothetical protein
MRRLITLAVLAAALALPASAQQPPPAPPPVAAAKPIGAYNLSPDQVATLKRAIALADFWLQVRVAAAGNGNVEGHGFELQRTELMGLAQELAKQEQAANPPIADPPLPKPKP